MTCILVPSPAPTIVATPLGLVEEGTTVTLQCSVTHARPGATLQWFRGQYDQLHGDFYQATSYDDVSVHTIELRAHGSDHGVTYRCVACNRLNEQEMTSGYAMAVLCESQVNLRLIFI